MKRFDKILLSLIMIMVIVASTTVLKAQQAILPDISYLYVEKLIAAAKENYPRVKTLNSRIEAAKSDLNIAKTSWLDPFSFQFVTRSNEANTNSINVTTADVLNGYQFGISLNPGTLLSKPSNIKKAREQVNIAKYEKDEYALNLELEVKKRYFLFLQYERALGLANKALLDAETNYNSIKLSFQKAELTLLEFNNASIIFNQASQTKLQTDVGFLTAKASLEELTVKKLEEIK